MTKSLQMLCCGVVVVWLLAGCKPASENCVAVGGTLEIRQGEGGEVGYCVFADGSECEEWALFRGECTPK
jgi:putative hemolysin